MNVIMAGTTSPMATSRPVETFSFVTYGKEMSASVTSKGLLLGVTTENPAPTAAVALRQCQLAISVIHRVCRTLDCLHYYDPVDDVGKY